MEYDKEQTLIDTAIHEVGHAVLLLHKGDFIERISARDCVTKPMENDVYGDRLYINEIRELINGITINGITMSDMAMKDLIKMVNSKYSQLIELRKKAIWDMCKVDIAGMVAESLYGGFNWLESINETFEHYQQCVDEDISIGDFICGEAMIEDYVYQTGYGLGFDDKDRLFFNLLALGESHNLTKKVNDLYREVTKILKTKKWERVFLGLLNRLKIFDFELEFNTANDFDYLEQLMK